MIKKIRQIVKDSTDKKDWKYHVLPVVKYSLSLAQFYDVDKKTVEIAALLHDIGRMRFGTKDHEVTGAAEAEKILKQLNYPVDVVDEVKHCILSHRGEGDILPKTLIAKIVANADAMAHFDIPLLLFFWRAKKQSFEEAFRWIDEKFKRDWGKKITLPEARDLTQDKYNAIRLILDSNRQYM